MLVLRPEPGAAGGRAKGRGPARTHAVDVAPSPYMRVLDHDPVFALLPPNTLYYREGPRSWLVPRADYLAAASGTELMVRPATVLVPACHPKLGRERRLEHRLRPVPAARASAPAARSGCPSCSRPRLPPPPPPPRRVAAAGA